MILYRPVGLQELELIYDSGMKAFPARLPKQPIFYPVLDLDYARQIASGWNVKSGQLAGYVTQFKVDDEYIAQFEEHTVRGSQHQELWIPAEEMEEFNRHILGHIKVLEAHFAETFQGFVPEKFALQGKDAVEQFTVLANSYLYRRMDFYLEVRRNHKAVFINYPFWQKHVFKNPGLKEKILQAVREAWFASFPHLPLPNPVPEESTPIPPREAQAVVSAVDEDGTLEEETDSANGVDPVHEQLPPPRQTRARAQSLPAPRPEETPPAEQPRSHTHRSVPPIREEPALPQPADSRFVQGIQLGLRGEYYEAIEALSQVVEEEPDHVAAHTSLGVAYHQLGEDEQALACYETALKIDPIYAEAHYFRANILYDQGNGREAIAGYTVAIGLQPELIEAHGKPAPEDRLTDYTGGPAGMHWIAKPAHRILHLGRSLEANPQQADLFKERAAAYYRLRNYAQAIADYSAALAIQPGDAGALHSRGLAYEQLGQSNRALEDYQQVLALEPQLWNDYINRGIAFAQAGNYRQALESLTEAIRLAPRKADGYFNRGMVNFQQGDFESAIEDLSNVIRLSPKDEAAYYWRGMSREEKRRRPEAIADYSQFLELSQDPGARAEIEQKLSRWSEEKRESGSSQAAVPGEKQEAGPVPSGRPDPELDLHNLIVLLGVRALNSAWFASGVRCDGEKAQELQALADQDTPIEGGKFISITSGIRQTTEGDFQAFAPGAESPWIFIRAWQGSGFYVETNEAKIKARLTSQFPAAEEVDGVPPPYAGLFIPV